MEKDFSIHYAYYGWVYYLGEGIFKFYLVNLANFLILSVVTLSFSLRVEKLKNESKEILMASKFGDMSVQEIIEKNREKLEELQGIKRRAKCMRVVVYSWTAFISLLVIASYITIYLKKR